MAQQARPLRLAARLLVHGPEDAVTARIVATHALACLFSAGLAWGLIFR